MKAERRLHQVFAFGGVGHVLPDVHAEIIAAALSVPGVRSARVLDVRDRQRMMAAAGGLSIVDTQGGELSLPAD